MGLLRHYLPPIGAWASTPARALASPWGQVLWRLAPAAVATLAAAVYAWKGPLVPELAGSAHAFFVPVLGLGVFSLARGVRELVGLGTEHLHRRWGDALWDEAPELVRLRAVVALRSSATARHAAQRLLARDPHGRLRARAAFLLGRTPWPDVLARPAPSIAMLTARDLEEDEVLRRRAAALAAALPAARPGTPRPRL